VLVSDEDEAVPFGCDEELLDGFCELLYVDDVVAPLVLGAFLFLCMSPSARAVPLVSTMMEEKNKGASLRMMGAS
jgi:hypothetical protein